MQLKGSAGGPTVLMVVARGTADLPGDGSGPGSPSKARRKGRRSRRLLQAAAALLGASLCCMLLAPDGRVQKELGDAAGAAGHGVTSSAVDSAANAGGGQAAAVGGAADAGGGTGAAVGGGADAGGGAGTAVGGAADTGGGAGAAVGGAADAGGGAGASVGGAGDAGGAAAAAGAADSAIWPTSDDILAQELQARRAFLRQQQAVRHQLATHRAAAATRRHVGFLPEPPPRVAMMFLVRGNMPQERVWRAFFEAAGEVEPVALPSPFAQLVRGAQRRHMSAASGVEAAGGGEGGASRPGVSRRLRQLGVQQLSKKPVTPEQQEQLEANHALEAALGQGERSQQAQQQALRSRSMEAPLSMLSPVDPEGVIARQDLFSVYVHTMPGFYYGNTSIFAGYQIDRRVYVNWGQYTVAEAERRLIISALAERRNQRFVLISETCTPLYPPHVIYLQLLSDTKSRVNACARAGGGVVERWNAALYMPGLLTPNKWRKSTQWKSLTRAHAELVAADRQLAPRFERECYSYLPPVMVRPAYVVSQNRTWVQRSCISDEHYIPTLLAAHGRDNETTCDDGLTVADWVDGLWSPVVHHAEDIHPDLIRRLRKQRGTDVDCAAAEAIASAKTMFRRRGAGVTLAGGPLPGGAGAAGGASAARRRLARQVPGDGRAQQAQQAQHTGYARLHQACFLLARKFSPDTAQLLLRLSEDCQEGTALSPKCLDA